MIRALILGSVALIISVCASAATLTLPSVTVPSVSACPDDDGSGGAVAGAANYPNLITQAGYKASINGAHGLGCKVAGVDYYVGVPPTLALTDPTTGVLPSGCKYDGKLYVNCTGTVVGSGYDFSLHGTLLTGNGNTTFTNSKFGFGPSCTDPVVNVSGSLTLTNFTIDGTAGWTCNLNQGFGTFVNVRASANSTITIEYFSLIKVPQDAFDLNAPSSGNVATTIKYGVIYLQGNTGHPDGVQYCGGGAGVMTPNDIEHVTWYNSVGGGAVAGTQPLHVEAQICSGPGHIANTVVAYNTVLAPGTCKGGVDWPTGCFMNYGIACKLDDPTSSNVNFQAYGNYVDWSGGIAALSNAYKCPSASFGSPQPNYDMVAGAPLSTALSTP